ncbi:MAG: hypothetical protein CMO01_14715 [Thalassobius sp.]|nr:hypothetical protein [Thalassovita sp.]
MKLNKKRYLKEAQIFTVIILNVVFASLIFLTVFQQDTDQIVFWKSYTHSIETATQNIEMYSGLYDHVQKPELLNSIKEEMLLLEEYLYYVKDGGYIKVKKQKVKVPKIKNRQVNEQIEKLYNIYKQEENDLKRSISNFQDNIQTSKYTSEDQFLAQVAKFAKTISLENNNLQILLYEHMGTEQLERNIFMFFCILCLLMINAFLIIKIHKDIFGTIKLITHTLHNYISKNHSKLEDFELDDIKNLKGAVNVFIENVETASEFAKSIGDGNLDVVPDKLNKSNILGNALLDMQQKLKQVTEEDKKRNWISIGVSKVSDILSEQYNDSFSEKVFQYTKAVTDYTLCVQGAIFLLTNDEQYLELFSSYAYQRKKYADERQKSDEGLIGQCLAEKDIIYMEEVPDDYVSITSGLGYANPRSLLLVPIYLDDKNFGVMELASFNKMPEYFVNFVKIARDKLAAAISTYKMNEHTSKLLDDSRKINVQLQVKEEKMQKQTSELNQQYSILNEKYLKSIETIDELKKLTEIKAYVEQLEIDLNKKNDQLQIFKKEVEIQDKNLDRKQAKIEKLQERLRKFGGFTEEEISMVERIKQLSDLNESLIHKVEELEKEKTLNQSTISSINQAIASAEIGLKGEIISCNQLFLDLFGYTSEELNGRHESILFAANDGSDRINDIKWKKLLKGETFKSDAHFIKKTKEKVLLRAGYTPVTLPSGRLFKVIMMIQVNRPEN